MLVRELSVAGLDRNSTDSSKLYGWLALTAVCQHWYWVATTQCAELWVDIRIPAMPAAFLHLALERANGALLAVTYNSPNLADAEGTESLHLLLEALAELQRIRELNLLITLPAYRAIGDALRQSAPSLCVYKIVLLFEDDLKRTSLHMMRELQDMSQLQVLEMEGICHAITWSRLCYPASLKVFTLDVMEQDRDHSLPRLLEGLAGMAALEVLTVGRTASNGLYASSRYHASQSFPVAHLPRLRQCNITGYVITTVALLAHLALPKTVQLVLDIGYFGEVHSNTLPPQLSANIANSAHGLNTLFIHPRSSKLVLKGGSLVIPVLDKSQPDRKMFTLQFRAPGVGDASLPRLLKKLPLSSVKRIIFQVPESPMHRALDVEEWASLAALMPRVEHLELSYSTAGSSRYRELDILGKVPPSAAGGASALPIWPSLSVLKLKSLHLRGSETAELVRDRMARREAHGCARLSRIVVTDSTVEVGWEGTLAECASEVKGERNVVVDPSTRTLV